MNTHEEISRLKYKQNCIIASLALTIISLFLMRGEIQKLNDKVSSYKQVTYAKEVSR